MLKTFSNIKNDFLVLCVLYIKIKIMINVKKSKTLNYYFLYWNFMLLHSCNKMIVTFDMKRMF